MDQGTGGEIRRRLGKVHARLGDQLSLHVRQLAWLNATPKPEPDPRGKRKGPERPLPISRREQLKKDGVTPKLPPVSAPHIIDRLVEIGLTQAAGMGAAPLCWGEIVAWQQATGVALAPWEARLIRRLSIEYLAESRRAESDTCPPPWRAPRTQRELDAEEARLRAVLG